MSRASLTSRPSKPSPPSASGARSSLVAAALNVAGRSGSRARTTTWEVITATASAATPASKGTSSRARSTSSGGLGHRQGDVRVGDGVAVSREVLEAGADPGRLQPVDEGGHVPRERAPAPAEAAHPDDRVERVGVDVGHGSEVEVDADARAARRRCPWATARVSAGRRPGPGRRARRAGCRPVVEAGDVAALLVERHDRVGSGVVDRGAEVGTVLERRDVLAEQADPAHPLGEPSARPSGQRCLRRTTPSRCAGPGSQIGLWIAHSAHDPVTPDQLRWNGSTSDLWPASEPTAAPAERRRPPRSPVG